MCPSRSGTGARVTGRGGRKRCCNRTVGRIGVRPMSGQSLSFSIFAAGWASSVGLVFVAVLVVLAFLFPFIAAGTIFCLCVLGG